MDHCGGSLPRTIQSCAAVQPVSAARAPIIAPKSQPVAGMIGAEEISACGSVSSVASTRASVEPSTSSTKARYARCSISDQVERLRESTGSRWSVARRHRSAATTLDTSRKSARLAISTMVGSPLRRSCNC